jgi:hypothetical protein
MVQTPRLALVGATDELLERLIPIIRAGVVDSGPLPFDDPMSLYEDSPAENGGGDEVCGRDAHVWTGVGGVCTSS